MGIQDIYSSTPAGASGILCRSLVLAYGVLAYAIFFGVFVYFMGFVMDLFVPRSVDRGPDAPPLLAVLANLGLIALFAVQHTLMARSGFKQWLTRFIPAAAERSTFVLVSSLVLAALCYYWRPLPGIVCQLYDRSLRPVRAAPGLAVFQAARIYPHAIRNPLDIQVYPSPPDAGPAARCLGYSGDDAGAPAAGRRADRLYPDWYWLRGA
jgi:hypothetical protein